MANGPGILSAIGRGLSLGGGVLNPQIFEQQQQERAQEKVRAQQLDEQRKNAMFQLIFSAAQEGAIPGDEATKALQMINPEMFANLPEGVLGPSAATQRALQQRQALEQFAGSLTDPRAQAAARAGQSGAAAKFELGTAGGIAPIRVLSGDTPEGQALGIPRGERARVKMDQNGQPIQVLGGFGKGPGVTVHVAAGENAFLKEAGKTLAQRVGATIETGNNAASMEQSLIQLGGLLSGGVPTGALQPAITGLQGIASDLGIDLSGVAKAAGVDLGSLATKEEFDRVSKALVIDGFEKFKGNLNQQEVKLATDAFPGLGRGAEGNRLAIASLLASTRLAQERAAEAAQASSGADARAFEVRKARAGTKRFEQIRKEILSQANGESTESPPAAGQPSAQPRRAPDGNLYVPDPARPGKFLRVDP